MRLRNLVILTVLVPLFLILLTFSLVTLRSLEDNMRAKLQGEVQTIARAIGSALSHTRDESGNDSLQDVLHSAFSFHRIYGAYVFDSDGEKRYGLGLGENLFSAEELREIVRNGEEVGALRSHEGWRYYSYLVPINRGGDNLRGVLQVNRLNTGIENYASFISLAALAIFLISSIGIVLLIWWSFRRHIERPINGLLRSMETVEKGDRSHRARHQGPQEMHRLSAAFNGMLDAMAEKDRDIAEGQRKEIELEKRLRKSKKLAELGVLAAGVAHEIGAPLTVINGQAQKLARRDVIGHDERARLARIRGEVDRIVTIVRQLMEMGRQHNLEKEPQRLDELIGTALQLVENELERYATQVTVDLPDPPPAPLVNGQQLVQVLANLLRNAIQASPGGRVHVSARCRDDELYLAVEDDGPGVPDADKPQVFDPFFTTKPVGQGSGLGLSMAHRIVSDHGGTLGVFDSELGGAGIAITLPMDQDEPGVE